MRYCARMRKKIQNNNVSTGIFSYIIFFSVCFGVLWLVCCCLLYLCFLFCYWTSFICIFSFVCPFPIPFVCFILWPGPECTYSILWIFFRWVIHSMKKNWEIFTGGLMVVKFRKRKTKCIQTSTRNKLKNNGKKTNIFMHFIEFCARIYFFLFALPCFRFTVSEEKEFVVSIILEILDDCFSFAVSMFHWFHCLFAFYFTSVLSSLF